MTNNRKINNPSRTLQASLAINGRLERVAMKAPASRMPVEMIYHQLLAEESWA
jgi:hypothetical protein